MQRRKGFAHIAAPLGKDSADMSSSSEKPSRFNQRSLGVTHRIWAIVLLFVFIVSFTRFALPMNGSQTRHTGLKSKNYLNTSSGEPEPNPFVFCPAFGPGDQMARKYGALTLSQSRLHLGSGGRIQRLIHKALLGQPVTISVLGGSISACHGAGNDPISAKCYPARFFDWWNSIFPHPASELTNGAMRKTNSAYYAYCNAHHLPDATDLVILEFDVSDKSEKQTVENFELLVRSILLREDQPAVLILGHFSPQIHSENGFGGPEMWHGVVAQFYDVPHISVKPALYPSYINNPSAISKFFTDPILANTEGHEVINDILVSYFQTQICAAWDIANGDSYESVPLFTETHGLFGGLGLRKGAIPEAGGPGDLDKDGLDESKEPVHPIYPQLGVPPSRINTRANSERAFEEVRPFCASANNLINPLPPSLFYGSGWEPYHPPTSGATRGAEVMHYWTATMPTSKLRIPITVGAGDVGIYYVQEPLADDDAEESAVECWVDDNYKGAKLVENGSETLKESTPALFIIDHWVSRGPHFVECTLMGEEGQAVPPFKIIGVFAT